ncbi:MAG: uroporphyrinogen decarboxylase family protein, partial [Lentisphaeria bacterium]|nr:uroporphyrinogen decarboxylase family protein [Lentisphaeria bacterium]
MTSRERVLAAISHRQPDRCATYHWFPSDTLALIAERLGVHGEDGVETALGIDRWRAVSIAARAPDQTTRIRRFVPRELSGRDDVEITPEGRVLKKHPGADYLEDVLWSPLQDVTDVKMLDDYPFPDPALFAVTDNLRSLVKRLKAQDAVVIGLATQPFKAAWYLRGFENFLCDFLVNVELAEYMYDRLYAAAAAQCVACAEAGADVVQIVGDIAMQDRLMMAPDTWRHFDRPRLTALTAAVKAA